MGTIYGHIHIYYDKLLLLTVPLKTLPSRDPHNHFPKWPVLISGPTTGWVWAEHYSVAVPTDCYVNEVEVVVAVPHGDGGAWPLNSPSVTAFDGDPCVDNNNNDNISITFVHLIN